MADQERHPEAALQAFVRRYKARKDALDQEARELMEERDQAILKAFAGGLTTREIAKTVGLSHQRVAQIVLNR